MAVSFGQYGMACGTQGLQRKVNFRLRSNLLMAFERMINSGDGSLTLQSCTIKFKIQKKKRWERLHCMSQKVTNLKWKCEGSGSNNVNKLFFYWKFIYVREKQHGWKGNRSDKWSMMKNRRAKLELLFFSLIWIVFCFPAWKHERARVKVKEKQRGMCSQKLMLGHTWIRSPELHPGLSCRWR